MMRFQYRTASGVETVKVPTWAMALISIVVALVGLTVIVLGAGLLLVIVPILVILGLVARWRLGKMLKQAQRARSKRYPDAIEGEFTVIDDGRPNDHVQPRR